MASVSNINMQQLSFDEKVKLILSRYRCTKDLWLYMTTRMGVLLPPLTKCQRKFLNQIMYQRKKYLLQKDVPAFNIPRWPELYVQNCYKTVTEGCPEVLEYLPDPCGTAGKTLPE